MYLDHPLLGGPGVPVECDGTTPMKYQKAGKGHPAVFKGCIVISATDRKYLRLALRPKGSRGSESYENLRCVPDWLDDDSILWFGNNFHYQRELEKIPGISRLFSNKFFIEMI